MAGTDSHAVREAHARRMLLGHEFEPKPWLHLLKPELIFSFTTVDNPLTS